MYKSFLLALFLVQICKSQSGGKRWVWPEGRRRSDDRYYTSLVTNDRKYTGELIGPSKPLFQPSEFYGLESNDKLRYEVTEPPYNGPDSYRPIVRPGGTYQRPDFIRPGGSTYKPIRPIENEYRPVRPTNYIPGGYRPTQGANGRPILTGPVPSWQQNNQNGYKDYDKCKCVHSFNCNTPGIKFGSCDVDKQYCCYKATENEGHNEIRPILRPNPDRPRPVLAGPGGPVDRPKRPNQGSYERPFRPFSEINRYIDSERDFDEAYKKGLDSAIHDLYDRTINRDGKYWRGYGDDLAKPSRGGSGKYGLYIPSDGYDSRSARSNITAAAE